MAPINLPDGSQVSEIVLPDGSTASEVLAPDGSTVFSAIPDNAVHQWAISEGSGTTVADSVGSADGTLSSEFWLSGTWKDGFALQGDGTDNYVDTGPNDSITGEIALLITIEINSFPSSGEVFVGSAGFDGSNTGWQIALDGDDSILYFGSYDGSQHRATYGFSNLSTNTKYRVVGQYRSGNWELWVNDVNEATNSDATGAVTSDSDRYFLANNGGSGSAEAYSDVNIDNPILCNGPVTDQEISNDYQRQPWT